MNTKLLLLLLANLCLAMFANETMSTEGEHHKEIRTTIQNYFDGRRDADINLLQKAFSEDARLMTTGPNQQLIIISLNDYFAVVKKQGKIKVDTKIIELKIENQLGFAKVIFDYGNKSYTDFLLLIKLESGWRIVNKSFKLDK